MLWDVSTKFRRENKEQTLVLLRMDFEGRVTIYPHSLVLRILVITLLSFAYSPESYTKPRIEVLVVAPR